VSAGSGGANVPMGCRARREEAGEAAWMRTFTSAGGPVTLTGLAVDAAGASPLDVLGLPRGAVASADSGLLTTRSALREGDEFKIGLDGQRLAAIRSGRTDTLASLAPNINRALGAGGRAEILKENGVERIRITARDGKAVRIDAGRDGFNALPALGLIQGVVAATAAGRGALKTYGLGLIAADLRLDTPENIVRTKA